MPPTILRLFTTPRGIVLLLAAIAIFWVSPQQIFSQTPDLPKSRQEKAAEKEAARLRAEEIKEKLSKDIFAPYDNFERPSLITQAVALSLMSLLPFIIMILTSFMKIVIVLSLLRSALGVQQAPPNQIINGIAFMLSLFIMYPTVMMMYDAAYDAINQTKAPDSLVAEGSSAYIIAVADQAKEPLRLFLKRNSSVKHHALFYRMAYRVLPENHRETLKPDDFMILVPSYITSQLKDAFEIGVLIYIPFFVIDLVTSNILLAMGMMMLSPVTISMPLKLFLLVMLDGWTLLIEGLVHTFR